MLPAPPLSAPHHWNGLIIVESAQDAASLSARSLKLELENALESALAGGVIEDAVLAANDRHEFDLISLREAASDAQKPAGVSFKHDVSLPLSAIPEFLAEAEMLVQSLCPGVRIVAFGHIGDGNLHYNISQPSDMNPDSFTALHDSISHQIHQLVHALGGSISAEHGIGLLRRRDFIAFTPPVEIETMRSLKRSLDPHNIMNPGKILPE